jgi:ATP-dependent DNA helicase RecQ
MLWGSHSSKLKKRRLDRLSTFGILSSLNTNEIVELLNALIEQGLIAQRFIDRHRPVVELTSLGGDVMRGYQEPPGAPPVSPSLLEKLRTVVAPAARESAPAREAPAKPAAAATEQERDEDTPPAAAFQSPHESAPPRQRPGYYWTWRLLADGFSLEECAAARNLSPEDVLDHALRAIDEGHPVDAARLLSPQQQAALAELTRGRPPENLRRLVEELPAGVGHRHLQLFLKTMGKAP